MDTLRSVAFGSLLRRHRNGAGLTQEELAERAGMSRRSIGNMERGVVHTPRRDTVALLAEALALDARDRTVFAEAARRVGTPVASGPGPVDTSAPPFVGRARELALLGRHLAGEGPPVLLLAGEPGIGKTRLLRAAFPRAMAEGLRVLEGGCQRRGGHEPYAPLAGALHRHIRGLRPDRLRADLQGCAWLVRLLPELADGPIPPLPPWILTPDQERRLMGEAVVRFLTNLAGPAGTLLVLDDLQWAGPDALDLLATLARSADEVPLRVIGAYRDTEVRREDPMSAVLADLAHEGLAARRLLGPLAPVEAGQLLDGLLAGEIDTTTALRERVLERAGGVPFFIVSCARALPQAGREDTREDAVPWDIGQSVRQRMAALPEAAREVMSVAAVVGRVVPSAVLTAVADQEEKDSLSALEAACRARLLVETEGDDYQFAHDVIREVIEADVGIARRMLLHRRVAEALERRPGESPVELLAYHHERSGEKGKAAPYLEQAGDRALAQYANAAAERYYRQTAGHLDATGRGPDAARVREKLSAVLFTVARYDGALIELEPALEAYRAGGDVEGQARVLAQIGWMHAARGTPGEGVGRLQPFLTALAPRGPSRGHAALYAALAWLYIRRGAAAESVTAAERAAALARAVGDDEILADVEVRRSNVLFGMGRAEEALRVLEDAGPLAEAAGDLSTLHRALSCTGWIHMDAGAFDKSRDCHLRALELAERLGHRGAQLVTTADLGAVLMLQGDWGTARDHLERAADLSRTVGWSNLSGRPFLFLAQLNVAEGAWAEASRNLEECQALAGDRADLRSWPEAQRLMAECEVLQGRPEAAVARLTTVLDLPALEDRELTMLLPALAWAHLARGANVEAAEMVAKGIRHARSQKYRLALVESLRVRAMVAIRQGLWQDAECDLEEGLALTRRMVYPYAEARLLHAYAEMHAQRGAPEPARARLEAALATFRRLGARKDAERAEQAIAAFL